MCSGMRVCVCVCMRDVHVYTYVYVGAHTWRPEEDVGCPPLSLSVMPLRQGLLLNLELPGSQLDWLANEPQQSCLQPLPPLG